MHQTQWTQQKKPQSNNNRRDNSFNFSQSVFVGDMPTLETLAPFVKIVTQRQALYFQMINFINKNIQSTSMQLDQISLFEKFLVSIKNKELELIINQNKFIGNYQADFQGEGQSDNFYHNNQHNSQVVSPQPSLMTKQYMVHLLKNQKKLSTVDTSKTNLCQESQMEQKQILRLCSRVMQVLQTSISKMRKTVFNDRVTRQFNSFQLRIQKNFKISPNKKILKQTGIDKKLENKINIANFKETVINYTTTKFKRELHKLEKYLEKLQNGEIVSLKQVLLKKGRGQGSDLSQDSACQKKLKLTQKPSITKNEHHSSSQSPAKKTSLRRPSRQKNRLLTKKDKEKVQFKEENEDSQQSQTEVYKKKKNATGLKLFKFYNLLQLSKKQFLEDYAYEDKKTIQNHKEKLYNTLLEKNKAIREQISQYNRKTINYQEKINKSQLNNQLKNSSDENHLSRNQSSGNSRMSLKASFIISKRRSSIHLQQGSHEKQKKQVKSERKQLQPENNIDLKQLSSTMKLSSTKKRSSSNSNRKSKQIFFAKAPQLFQDQILNTKAKMQSSNWMQTPIAIRERQKQPIHYKQRRKNYPIRQKRRNNPVPIENSCLPQSFHFKTSRYQNPEI